MLNRLINEYATVLRNGGLDDVRQRLEARKKEMKTTFSMENVSSLSYEQLETVFNELETVERSRASMVFHTIAAKYGVESLREHISYFLYGSDTLEDRFDKVFTQIPELPQLGLMEIATLAQPTKFCIWDHAAKQTIIFIGHSSMHGLSKTAFNENISGLDYVFAKLALNHLREHLAAYLNRKVDFVEMYLFTSFSCSFINKTLKASV
ncbi:MAG: hypothetical protein QXH12_05475 [Candidatus Caldarchaeum sp.]|uniref:Uncharacterized protein n=1 Tax=Caldiarchaeum subterraneum TaxID=311458 RepID=A0A7C5LCV4_CALS0